MIIDIDDDKLYLLLKTLGIAHVISNMNGDKKEEAALKDLIEFIAPQMVKAGKQSVFERVYLDIIP